MIKLIKPKPLQQGDTVSIIAPASPIDKNLIDKCVDSLNALGLKVVVGESCLSDHGFLSGTDDIRANDINYMFANKKYTIINNAINVDKFVFNRKVRNDVRTELNL